VGHVLAGGRAHLRPQQPAAVALGIDTQDAVVVLAGAGPPLALEANLAGQDATAVEVLEPPPHDRHIGVGEDDHERRAALEAVDVRPCGVDPRDVALVGRLVQERRALVAVADQEHRQAGDLQGAGIDRRQAALVELDERLEADVVDVRTPAQGHDDPIHRALCGTGAHPHAGACGGELGVLSQVQREFAPQQLHCDGIHRRIGQSAELLDAVERHQLHAEPRERLRDLDADGAQAHHRHARGKVLLLEQRIRGEQPLAQVAPGFRHDRVRAGGDDDPARSQLPAVDLQPIGTEQTRATGDGPLAQPLGRLQGAAHELVAQPAHAPQHRGDVGLQPLGTGDAELREAATAMIGVGRLDQGLRGHAADARADGPPWAVVDDDEALRAPAHLPKRREAGGAGADDDDVERFVHGDLLCDLGQVTLHAHHPQPCRSRHETPVGCPSEEDTPWSSRRRKHSEAFRFLEPRWRRAAPSPTPARACRWSRSRACRPPPRRPPPLDRGCGGRARLSARGRCVRSCRRCRRRDSGVVAPGHALAVGVLAELHVVQAHAIAVQEVGLAAEARVDEPDRAARAREECDADVAGVEVDAAELDGRGTRRSGCWRRARTPGCR